MSRSKNIFLWLLFGLFLTQLTACHYLSFARLKTQQGNLIKQKQLRKVKIGMHKTDVAILLGHTLITPTFQKNRWDYVFTYQVGEGPILIKRASLFFENDKLVKIITLPKA